MTARSYLPRRVLYTLICVAAGLHLFGQHDHHEHQASAMSHGFSRNLPMNRNGSGTAWLPDSTPMYGYMVHRKKCMLMWHGNVFVRYNDQDVFGAGSRGGEKADAVSWAMVMGQRTIGSRGLFRLSGMISLDPLFGGEGYPLLYQSGETWRGRPLVDRQHPHDLISELSVGYTHMISDAADIFIYAGYPGEPALGSVAFMHRVSSLYGPDAPLSHHWNDATHITFGTATAGLRVSDLKFEVSSFTGREPDEDRYDFDEPRFDSYCGRISYNPSVNWALQLSHGFVRSPEWLEPGENVSRTTMSAVYSRPLAANSFFNATTLWAMNQAHTREHAILMEAAVIRHRLALFSRFEFVQKSTHELALDEDEYGHDGVFNVNALTAGTSYDLFSHQWFRIAAGLQGSLSYSDRRLRELYGEFPVSGQVFIRLYPPRMR